MTPRPSCALCQLRPAAGAFPADPFTWRGLSDPSKPPQQIGDSWACCFRCASFVADARWSELADLTVAGATTLRPELAQLGGALREEALALHQRFHTARRNRLFEPFEPA